MNLRDLTYEFPLFGRLIYRNSWFSLWGTPLWKNRWMIRLTFWKRTVLTDKWRRERFRRTLHDGYFWKRFNNYVMNKSCDWYECEMCSSNPEAYLRGDEDYE